MNEELQARLGSINGNGLRIVRGMGGVLRVRTSVPSLSLNIKTFYFDENGNPSFGLTTKMLPAAGDRTENVFLFSLPRGFLIGMVVDVPSSTLVHPGQCLVDLGVSNSPTAEPTGALSVEYQDLASGYVTSATPLSWPYSGFHSSVEEFLSFASVQAFTNPAGTDITLTVPNHARWNPKSLTFQLVTNAVVANRIITLIIDDGTAAGVIWEFNTNFSQVASTTDLYIFNPIVPVAGFVPTVPTGFNAEQMFTLPDLFLQAGCRIRTSTAALNAGDLFQSIRLDVREWIDPGTLAGSPGGGGGPT